MCLSHCTLRGRVREAHLPSSYFVITPCCNQRCQLSVTMKPSMLAAPMVMLLWNKVGKDVTEPQILAGYGTALILTLGTLAYIYMKVQEANDSAEVTVKSKKPNGCVPGGCALPEPTHSFSSCQVVVTMV